MPHTPGRQPAASEQPHPSDHQSPIEGAASMTICFSLAQEAIANTNRQAQTLMEFNVSGKNFDLSGDQSNGAVWKAGKQGLRTESVSCPEQERGSVSSGHANRNLSQIRRQPEIQDLRGTAERPTLRHHLHVYRHRDRMGAIHSCKNLRVHRGQAENGREHSCLPGRVVECMLSGAPVADGECAVICAAAAVATEAHDRAIRLRRAAAAASCFLAYNNLFVVL